MQINNALYLNNKDLLKLYEKVQVRKNEHNFSYPMNLIFS